MIQQARMRALQQHQLNNRNQLQSQRQASPDSQGQDTGSNKSTTPGVNNAYKKNGLGTTVGGGVAKTPQQLQALQQLRKQQSQQQLDQAYLAQKRNPGGGMSPGPYNGAATPNTLYNNNAKYPTAAMQGGRRWL